MRPMLVAAIVAAWVTPALAAERLIHCRITVGGKTYLDGPCMFAPDPDGSFTIGVGTQTVGQSPYFAYVTKNEDGTAEAYWNATRGSTHAHAHLGTVRQRGACWVNSKAELCAY